jgi:hypothetical protein
MALQVHDVKTRQATQTRLVVMNDV